MIDAVVYVQQQIGSILVEDHTHEVVVEGEGLQGATGATGATGQDGKDGKDGAADIPEALDGGFF